MIPQVNVESADIPGQIRISGHILQRDVSLADFMQRFDEQRVEWVNGVVIEMPGIDERHDGLIFFLRLLLSAFLEPRKSHGSPRGDACAAVADVLLCPTHAV